MIITQDEILDIFAAETSVARERLVPTATLVDLDVASLDIISVSFAIEDRFGVVVEPEAFGDCTCLADVVRAVQVQAEAQGHAKAA